MKIVVNVDVKRILYHISAAASDTIDLEYTNHGSTRRDRIRAAMKALYNTEIDKDSLEELETVINCSGHMIHTKYSSCRIYIFTPDEGESEIRVF